MVGSKKQVIVGIDAGNTRVVTVIMTQDKETGDLNILGQSDVPMNGLRKGVVTDIEETIAAFAQSLEEAERVSGVPVEHALLSISGSHVQSSRGNGVVAISHGNSEIAKDDIARVIDATKAFAMPANREIIHIIPRSFYVDGQDGVKDPLGMRGVKLELDAHIVTASSPAVKNLLKCAYDAGVDIEELVFSPLAAARSILSRKQKEIGVVLIDIGGGGTNIAVFEEGEILHSAFIPVGSSHITNDIAIGLKTSVEFAEKVKIDHGSATTARVSERDTINLSEIDPTAEKGFVSRKYIVEIMNARLEELFMMVRDELKKIDRDGLLPAGAILTGGGSRIDDITDVARDILRLPAQMGKISDGILAIDKDIIENPSYSTAIGLALWGFDLRKDSSGINSFLEGMKNPLNVFSKVKKIFGKK